MWFPTYRSHFSQHHKFLQPTVSYLSDPTNLSTNYIQVPQVHGVLIQRQLLIIIIHLSIYQSAICLSVYLMSSPCSCSNPSTRASKINTLLFSRHAQTKNVHLRPLLRRGRARGMHHVCLPQRCATRMDKLQLERSMSPWGVVRFNYASPLISLEPSGPDS
ncbi:hypothetical protein BJ165DRAFT_564480 [Panaeolus papilionaceus]|nr:hypothetical protein BJ165DRAFT_564480 [Panaeolus papilionaceus]